MIFRQIEDKDLAQYSYLIGCQKTKEAIIVDPQRDIDKYYDIAEKENVEIIKAIDTHIHADYLTGLREFAERKVKVYGSKEGGDDWQYDWLLNSNYSYELVGDKDEIQIGNIILKAIHTPGHTPEHLTYLVIDKVRSDQPMGALTGDFIFVGDVGRPDLLESAAKIEGEMEPSARTLFNSIREFKKQSPGLMIFPGHGSGSACGKSLGAVPYTTMGYEIQSNPALKFEDEESFVNYILEDQPEPPMYFAKMKKQNKEGPKLYKYKELEKLEKPRGIILNLTQNYNINAIKAKPGKQVAETAGSYIDEHDEITLLGNKNLNWAEKTLMKIGLDNVSGFIEELEETIQTQKESYQLLDVRKSGERKESPVPNSIHAPHTRLPEHLNELDKDKEILVFCETGDRSERAASYLRVKGYTARSIRGTKEARNIKIFK